MTDNRTAAEITADWTTEIDTRPDFDVYAAIESIRSDVDPDVYGAVCAAFDVCPVHVADVAVCRADGDPSRPVPAGSCPASAAVVASVSTAGDTVTVRTTSGQSVALVFAPGPDGSASVRLRPVVGDVEGIEPGWYALV